MTIPTMKRLEAIAEMMRDLAKTAVQDSTNLADTIDQEQRLSYVRGAISDALADGEMFLDNVEMRLLAVEASKEVKRIAAKEDTPIHKLLLRQLTKHYQGYGYKYLHKLEKEHKQHLPAFVRSISSEAEATVGVPARYLKDCRVLDRVKAMMDLAATIMDLAEQEMEALEDSPLIDTTRVNSNQESMGVCENSIKAIGFNIQMMSRYYEARMELEHISILTDTPVNEISYDHIVKQRIGKTGYYALSNLVTQGLLVPFITTAHKLIVYPNDYNTWLDMRQRAGNVPVGNK